MSVAPIAPLGIEAAGAPLITQLGNMGEAIPASATTQGGFASLLAGGIGQVESKLGQADDLVRRFALGDAVPVHQVTYALEEARLSVELAMQVRARLIESYRELMNMQL